MANMISWPPLTFYQGATSQGKGNPKALRTWDNFTELETLPPYISLGQNQVKCRTSAHFSLETVLSATKQHTH